MTREGALLVALAAVAALAIGGAGCGSQGSGSEAVDGGGYAPSAPAGPCGAVVQQHPIEGQTHVNDCTVVDYKTHPPSSGDHYAVPAEFKSYATRVPEGFWVHDLEHGAVVLTYNCTAGGGSQAACDADVTAATRMIAGLPDDPTCDSEGQVGQHRIVMTPDPLLDVRFAASSWGWTLRANCFDPSTFGAFVKAHTGRAPEDLCVGTEDPTLLGLPQNCGLE